MSSRSSYLLPPPSSPFSSKSNHFSAPSPGAYPKVSKKKKHVCHSLCLRCFPPFPAEFRFSFHLLIIHIPETTDVINSTSFMRCSCEVLLEILIMNMLIKDCLQVPSKMLSYNWIQWSGRFLLDVQRCIFKTRCSPYINHTSIKLL